MNLTTLAWPTHLGILYEWVRPQGLLEMEVVLGGIAVVLTCLALWKLRRQKLILFGLLWFVLALAPTSQVMLHHIARADRFLYLPLAGLVMAGALAFRRLPIEPGSSGHRRSRPLAAAAGVVAGVAVLLTLNLLTATQVQTWRNSTAVWTRCIQVAPANALAHGCLADSLSREGRFEEAIPHFEMSLQLEPDSVDSLNNYAIRLATSKEERLRDYQRAVQLARRGCELSRWEDWTLRRTLAKACSNYAKVFDSRGQYGEAIRYCRMAREADPGFDAPAFNLAVILATCPDEDFRRPEEAVRLAEEANALAEAPDAMRLRILAIAYAAAGQFENAVATLERAVPLARAAGHLDLAGQLSDELDSYRQRAPQGHESRTVTPPNSEE
jgi:tetratricopeptide (TPR) repeat protein